MPTQPATWNEIAHLTTGRGAQFQMCTTDDWICKLYCAQFDNLIQFVRTNDPTLKSQARGARTGSRVKEEGLQLVILVIIGFTNDRIQV